MSPDELYALGYSLYTSTWGVRIFYQAPEDPLGHHPPEQSWVQHFTHAVSDAECARRGWELAAADYVRRRLDT